MKEFERLLSAYRGGKVDLESLQAGVESLVGGSDGTATEALMLLDAARAGDYRSRHTRPCAIG